MLANILVEVDGAYETRKGKSIDENHIVFVDCSTVFLLKVKPTDIHNLYIQDSVHTILAENVNVVDEEELLDGVVKTLNGITLFQYLSKICDLETEYNFNLIADGDYKVKGIGK